VTRINALIVKLTPLFPACHRYPVIGYSSPLVLQGMSKCLHSAYLHLLDSHCYFLRQANTCRVRVSD
jgi:hypothetical protein